MDKIIKYTPLLSAILIFLGYLNYYFYYSFFGIEIENYLTSGELLFSFLKLTIPFLYIFFGVLVIIFSYQIQLFYSNNNDDSSSTEKNDNKKDYVFFVEVFKEINLKNFSIKTLFKFLTQLENIIWLLSCNIFLILFPFYIINQIKSTNDLLLNSTTVLVLSFIWLVYFESLSQKLKKRKIGPYKNDTKFNPIYYIFILFFLGSFIYLKNKEKALSIINNRSRISVILYLGKEKIKTSNDLIFIGQTENYFFFRNNKNNSNLVINSKEIKKVNFYNSKK